MGKSNPVRESFGVAGFIPAKTIQLRRNRFNRIHKMPAKILGNHNGWGYFYVIRDGELRVLESLRQEKRVEIS